MTFIDHGLFINEINIVIKKQNLRLLAVIILIPLLFRQLFSILEQVINPLPLKQVFNILHIVRMPEVKVIHTVGEDVSL